MMRAAEVYVPSRAEPAWALSPQAAGVIALIDGIVTLAAVAFGADSWILMGIAVIVWIMCGWSIYFRPQPSQRVVALLGTLLLVSAGIAALTVLSGLYLLVLGPSWIL
jgi:hypothetical protein